MIRLENVSFSWRDTGPEILNIPEFTIATGERVFLQGPSGSGKTTLLNLLGGLNKADSGSVDVDGTNLSRLNGAALDRFRADRVGFIFQIFNLLPYLSLIENVALPCWFSSTRAARAESRSGSVTAEAIRLLEAMEIDATARGGGSAAALSTGQQQRVAAARSLIGSPRLIIADEPTSALDHETAAAFMTLLGREAADSGATLLLVSHDTSLAPLFDRHVRLDAINEAGKS